MGLLKGVEKKVLNDEIEKYASKVNLLDVLDRKVGTYSGGMKQRLLIAQAFLGDSKIIIFDEPTAGLDPKERIHVRNLIILQGRLF
jgi:ABC-2 type transport system ATP-binding protein